MSTNDLLITNREEVRKQWKKTAADVQKDIETIKSWANTQKHLPEVPSDNMIEFILTNCKFSIEKTKINLDMYYTIRSLMPDVFDKSNPELPSHQSVFETVDYLPLPKLTESLNRIIVMKFKEDCPDTFDPYKLLIYGTNTYEVRIHEDLVMGEILLVDCKHFKMGHIVKFTPTAFKKIMFPLENIWSSRLKQIHVINYPSFVDKIMVVVKGVMKKKMYDRIFFHQDLESIYKEIPKSLLPNDYGGDLISLHDLAELWKLKFKECKARFDQLDKLRVDESVRPEPLSNSEVLGYYGNFKKLDVD